MARPRRDESRAAESRQTEKRDMPQGGYESALYVPPEIVPHGMTYRWVRLSTINEPDHGNWSKRTRQGYKPVPRDRHLDIWPYIPMPGHSTDSNAIINGGLILCEIPTHVMKAAKKHQEAETAEQMNAIAWTTEGLNNAPKINESGRAQHGVVEFKSDA